MDGTATTDVTRIEIAEAVHPAFGEAGATREELLEVAGRGNARPDVVRTLESLPDAGFRHVRELWRHLPELPVH